MGLTIDRSPRKQKRIMHFQVEKARHLLPSLTNFAHFPLLCSRFSFDPLLHLLAFSPSLVKKTTSSSPNMTPSLFHTRAYFFYPFSSWRGRLLGCSWYLLPSPRAREAIIGSQMHSRRVPSAPLIKSLMRLPIEGGDKNAVAEPSRAEPSRVESSYGKFYTVPFRWIGVKRKTIRGLTNGWNAAIEAGNRGKNRENRVSVGRIGEIRRFERGDCCWAGMERVEEFIGREWPRLGGGGWV